MDWTSIGSGARVRVLVTGRRAESAEGAPRPATAPMRGLDGQSPTGDQVRADFNGDGYSDLAMLQDWSVRIMYGSSDGFQVLNTAWIADTSIGGPVPEGLESWGATVAAADFDGDHYTDLAVGIFEMDVASASQAGSVYVMYGSPGGLDATRRQVWSQATPGIAGRAEGYDNFGAALTAGDFDNSGQADLAIGVHQESVDGQQEAGAVHVLYGTDRGLTATGSQMWTEASPGVPGRLGPGRFGTAMTVGRFDGGRYDDLVIGVPGQTISGHRAAGAVLILSGSPIGLTSRGAQRWSQDSAGILEDAETDDTFGADALVAGRFAGGSYDALAIGVAEESVGAMRHAGAVQVIFGSAHGLTATGNQLWTEATPGIAGKPTASEVLGASLAAADFGRGRAEDLAIGVPRGGPDGGPNGAGAVHVLYGTTGGLTAIGSQYWTQRSDGVDGRAEAGDDFGLTLAAADFGNGGVADLVVGAPSDWVGPEPDPFGSCHILYGTASGLTGHDSMQWSSLDFAPLPERIDRGIGYGLEAG